MKRWLASLVLVLVVLTLIPPAISAQEFRNMELNPFVAFTAHTKSNYEIGFPQSIIPIDRKSVV